MKKYCFFLLLSMSSLNSVFAGYIRLYNNTGNRLSVVIESFSGSFLDEMIIEAQDSRTWTDTYDNPTDYRGVNKPLRPSAVSRTPYTVSWYCTNGQDDPYSVCTNVAEGSLVMANSCSGLKGCEIQPQPGSSGSK